MTQPKMYYVTLNAVSYIKCRTFSVKSLFGFDYSLNMHIYYAMQDETNIHHTKRNYRTHSRIE